MKRRYRPRRCHESEATRRAGRLLVLGMVAACGRFDFEASDARLPKPCPSPLGHDEDRDGIDDACDGCPHIPDPEQIDSDGDGVDDVCDPNPTSPRETIAFFDPFVTQRSEWSFGPMPTIANDAMSIDATSTIFAATLGVVAAFDTFAIGGHVGTGPIGPHQLTISIAGVPPEQYYCEIQGGPTSAHFGATHTLDASSYTHDATTPALAPIENTDLAMTMFHTPTTIGCGTTYPVDMPRVDAARPAIAPVKVTLVAIAIEMRFDYFIQIHTE